MEPIPVPEQSPSRARQILIAAAVVHIALFVLEARGSFAALFATRTTPSSERAGPFAKGADCIGYYAWLRSLLIDGDFHFDDEYAPMFVSFPETKSSFPLTATGHLPNPWSVGPAIVWAPAVFTVHIILGGLGTHSPWPADGYSAPYQIAVGGTTLALALVTLVLGYWIARRFAGPTASAAAAATMTLGTTVVAYGAVEVSMAHGPAAAALALFAHIWLRTFGSLRPRRWIGLGCLLGLVCLMRWQLATFAALPTLEAIWLTTRVNDWSSRIGIAVRLVASGLSSMIVFAPQLLAMWIVYGHPLGGLHRTARNWLDPSLWAVLGAYDRSLFYWTPITLPAIAGLAHAAFRLRRPAMTILAAAVAIQIYAVAALLGLAVFLGWSFGFRFLTETCILLVPGAAYLIEMANSRARRWIAFGGGLLVGWNLILLGVYRYCVGGVLGGDPSTVLTLAERYIVRRPLDALGMMAAGVWLTYTLVLKQATRPLKSIGISEKKLEIPLGFCGLYQYLLI